MRFFGVVGYGESQETLPDSGIWEDVITEVNFTGDVPRDMGNPVPGDNVNNDLRVNNSISIVADARAVQHFHNIKYVMWQGVRWTVETVEVKPPRLLLTIGGVYNGPTPAP
jgi:hypothetical protein